MDLHFATAWEHVADTVPELDAVVHGRRRLTYGAFDECAARFAAALEDAGVGVGGKVALFLYNGPEYLIAQYGSFKHRAVPINVNYRYLGDELVYLLENCDAEVLVFHRSLAPRVAGVSARLPRLRLLVEVDDGGAHLDESVDFDELVAAHEPQERKERSRDDLYMLYTGGTTGNPKGVMFHQGDFVERLYGAFATFGLQSPLPTSAEHVISLVREVRALGPVVSVACCPLMHGTAMWLSAMRALLSGGTVVLLEHRTFDPHEVWSTCQREGANEVVIVGDAFARPMLRALVERESAGRPYDTSGVRTIVSSGAIWSAEIKDQLRSRLTAQLIDALGSTEAGSVGVSVASADARAETAKFFFAPTTRVITEDDRDVAPGSGVAGRLVSQNAAFGYYKDDVKSRATFVELDGRTFVITGDWATVGIDGEIALLGRGSMCINSGGEKIFAEEVEEAIKRHPGVDDCQVVALADERFGQRVVAVASSSTLDASSGDAIREWLRSSLAHYKIPRTITILDTLQRSPNGKADYAWAREAALAHGGQ